MFPRITTEKYGKLCCYGSVSCPTLQARSLKSRILLGHSPSGTSRIEAFSHLPVSWLVNALPWSNVHLSPVCPCLAFPQCLPLYPHSSFYKNIDCWTGGCTDSLSPHSQVSSHSKAPSLVILKYCSSHII